jgi:protein-S-isoprenylcysteine O-methyltransferase Ste14
MKRWFYLAYGLSAYVMFLAVYAYFAGFVGNFVVPGTIDFPVTSHVVPAVGINLLLVGAFAVQHSVMARPAFKRWWTQIVPSPIERSTYVHAANLVTILLIWQWRPIPWIVWDAQSPAVRAGLWILFGAGWLAVPAVSLLINHFDLFGLRQVWLPFVGRPYTHLPFRTPLAYAHVRHPLYLGWALAFWATPTMTLGHLLLAVSLTVYMALAAVIEESDLVAHFGQHYREYRESVPMFVPSLRPVRTANAISNNIKLDLPPNRNPAAEVHHVQS